MKIELSVTKADLQICYSRVLNQVLEHIPEDYPFWDDLENLSALLQRVDNANRDKNSQALIAWLKQTEKEI